MIRKLTFIALACMPAVAPLQAQPGSGAGGSQPVVQPLGNLFNDAQFLVERTNQKNLGEIVRILQFYGVESSEVSANVYLAALFPDSLERDVVRALSSTKALAEDPLRVSRATSGLADLFPANKVVDGLGTFIAERFKEELTQRYLEAFRDSLVMHDHKYHYSVLLPKTYSALLIYENVFDYKSFMTALKEAFKEDLDNLAPNSLEFIHTFYESGQLKADSSAFYLSYYIADYLVNKLPAGVAPSYLLLNIDSYPYKEKLRADVYGSIKVGNVVATHLQDNQGEVSSQKIRDLLLNRRRLLAFSGLLIEAEKETLEQLTIGGKNGFALLNDSRVTIIADVAQQVETLRRAFEKFAASTNESKDVIELISRVTPAAQRLLTIAQGSAVTPGMNKVFASVESFTNIYEYARQEKYGLVITEALAVFDTLGLRDTGFYLTFKKYGLFISNVAQAENAQQVKEALDVAALPVGSYKIKRNAFFDLSLNAFPGLAAGVEFRSDIPEGADVEEVTPTVAFSVPVGLAFSWGRQKTKTGASARTSNQNEFRVNKDGKTVTRYFTGRSHSLFFSVIDVGAVTSFRLADDETEALPDFTWSNILAPGIYYVHGMRDTPLSCGLGVQYGPQLRTIDQDGTELELAGSLVSVRVFLAVDIPIFSFYTRNTIKKNNR